jgi:hypothetical protein
MIKHTIIWLLGGLVLLTCSPKVAVGKPHTQTQADTVKHELNGKTYSRIYDKNGQLSFNNELAEFFNNWKKDSNNLDGFRRSYTKALSQEIYFFTGIKKPDIIKYMGPGNAKKNNPHVIRYNLEPSCGNPEYDCCWMELYFDENQLVQFSSIVCT